MMKPKQHGGARAVKRNDDGRLRCKMENGKSTTIRLPEAHLERMRQKYGRNWGDVVRRLIAEHLAKEK